MNSFRLGNGYELLSEWVEVYCDCNDFIVVYNEIEVVCECIEIGLFCSSKQLGWAQLFRIFILNIFIWLCEVGIFAEIVDI